VAQLKQEMTELVDRMRATPTAPGVDAIRIPSERAFAERARRIAADRIEIGRAVHAQLLAI
jgi:LDH2 family malate/lactate/ureidoglycolate dehydrogenase